MHLPDYADKVITIATLLTAAIALGTDFFFAFVGRKALSNSDEASLLNVNGFPSIGIGKLRLVPVSIIVGS